MFDVIIRGGAVVDGTGAPARRADVAIKDDRIVEIGDIDGDARRSSTRPARSWLPASSTSTPTSTRRCSGTARSPRRRCTASPPRSPATAASRSRRCRTTPPTATTSCACSLASRACRSSRCATACRGTGRRPGSTSTRIDGTLGINVGFMVGHSAIRRVVMGERVHQARVHRRRARPHEATAARRARRRRLRLLVVVGTHPQRRRRPHGAVALRDRTTRSSSCAACCGEFPGTSLEFIPQVGPRFDDGRSSSWPTCRSPRSARSTGT